MAAYSSQVVVLPEYVGVQIGKLRNALIMEKCFCRQRHGCKQSAESLLLRLLSAEDLTDCSRSFKCRTEVPIAKALPNALSPGGGCHIPHHMLGVCVQSTRSRSWQMHLCGWDVAAVDDHRDKLGMRLSLPRQIPRGSCPARWHLLLCC